MVSKEIENIRNDMRNQANINQSVPTSFRNHKIQLFIYQWHVWANKNSQ